MTAPFDRVDQSARDQPDHARGAPSAPATSRAERRAERHRYRRTDAALFALAVLYVVVSVAVRVRRRPDVFPISSWALFSKVPNELHDYAIRFTEIDGRPLDKPAMFEQVCDRFPSARPSAMKMLVAGWGAAIERQDAATAASIRDLIEHGHLRDHPRLRFDVVARRFDPLERWHDGEFREVRLLGSFRTTAQMSSTRDDPDSSSSPRPPVQVDEGGAGQ